LEEYLEAGRAHRGTSMKPRYAVVFIQGRNNYNAYAPDVDGCISAAETWEEILAMMTEALTFHIEAMLEDGEPIPESRSSINDAIADFLEPIPDDVMRSYREFGEPEPPISVTFQMVEIEAPVAVGTTVGEGATAASSP
jgi:predicted RNase H-like HicB family nuclease